MIFLTSNFLKRAISWTKKIVSCTKNVDIIFHFAGMADIDQANKFPADSLNLNINGTINVFEACVKNKVKKLIFASSIYALSEQGVYSKANYLRK